MVKNSVVLSVSISKEEATFIDEKKLSASSMLQAKIQEQKEIFEKFRTETSILHQNILRLQKELELQGTFLEEIKKFEEYAKWRGQYVGFQN